MLLQNGQSVPAFQANDVYGTEISTKQFKGKKTLISFQRNVGCPICNLHVHSLLQKAEDFKKQGIQVILVYQSSRENMKKYLGDEKFPFLFIPDSTNKLYGQFAVKKSLGKLFKANFHGAMGKMKAGKKLFNKKISMDGDLTMVGADFLIGPDGLLQEVHYGDYVGDHFSADQVLEKFSQTSARLLVPEMAPDFTATTIDSVSFRLSDLKGKKIFLSFFRNGACAMCNLRVHELKEKAAEFSKAGIHIVAVFESSIADMKPFVGTQHVPFTLLSDPQGILYNLYKVENSEEKIQQVIKSGVVHERRAAAEAAGFLMQMQAGANFNRLPAEFLIGPDFRLLKVHYTNQVIDHLPIAEVVKGYPSPAVVSK